MTVRRVQMIVVGFVLLVSVANLVTIARTPIMVTANVAIVLVAAWMIWRIGRRKSSA